tara:strand:- start:461 stop:1846 length:1386 start_codon:yes stop_codon:yes gene_type:complete
MIGVINDRYNVITDPTTGVRVITAKFWDNCEDKLGKYMEDTDWDFVCEEDTDFYAPAGFSGENNEDNIIFKFRKNVFTVDQQHGAYEGLLGAALPTQNRGLAAGPKGAKQGGRDWVTEEHLEIMKHFAEREVTLFDDGIDAVERIKARHAVVVDGVSRGIVWIRSKITDTGYNYETFFNDKVEEWKGMSAEDSQKDAKATQKNYISETTYANMVLSGIAGFFDRYPRIPYGRATAYTENNYSVYEKCYPFMRQLSAMFKEHLPIRYGIQNEAAAKLDPRFRVAGEDTPFTTVTVNKNFRTACHRDAGDLNEGFSNLTVVAKAKNWEGGYLVLPEFRVGINIRPGDLLLINNHGGIHGNTELKPPAGTSIEDMERISLVCYFREKMLDVGTWEYESLRKQYVDDRRLNKDHKLWKSFWNGVSPSMWAEDEWFDYLKDKGGIDMLNQYHPEAESQTSLEGFFS